MLPSLIRPSLLWLLMMLAVRPSLLAEDAGAPSSAIPEYRLRVGQQLDFESYSESQHGDRSIVVGDNWTFWVVDENPDGTWKVLVRRARDINESDARQEVGEFKMDAHGYIVWNKSLGFQIDPSVILVRLPESEAELKDRWTMTTPETDATVTCTLKAAEMEEFVWDYERTTSLDPIYESTHGGTVTFDRRQGLPRLIESHHTQGYGFTGKGTGLTELVSVTEFGDKLRAQLLADAEVYFADSEAYAATTKAALDHPERVTELLNKASEERAAAVALLKSDVFRELAEQQNARSAHLIEYYTDEAESRAKILGEPTPEWEAVDFAGQSHSPAIHKGKVVLLDFWYRGCGWCVRAMPQINRLAKRFAGEPVVILGMNTDQDEADAQLVIEKMRLRYPNVKAEGIPEKYGIRGFPTLVILD
ncbi:MAG: TlpA disulfide reductase family protein [Planctomycetaceae bacterium]